MECLLIFIIVIVVVVVIVMVTLLLLLSSMMILIMHMGPYLSSDNLFQVYDISCDSLLLHCVMVCYYKLLHLFK